MLSANNKISENQDSVDEVKSQRIIAELEKENARLKKQYEELENKVLVRNKISSNISSFFTGIDFKIGTEAKGKLLDLLQLTFDAVILFNKEETILDCNEACLSLFEFAVKSEIIGKKYKDIVKSDNTEGHCVSFEELSDGKCESCLEKRFVTNNGRVFTGVMNSTVINKNSGLVAAVIHDMSLQKESDELERKQIAFLTKTDKLNRLIYNSKTIIQLNRGLCKNFIELSDADHVCLLDRSAIDGGFNLRSYDLSRGNDSVLCENALELGENTSSKLSDVLSVEGISVLLSGEILKLEFLKDIGKIKVQLLMVISIKNGKELLICLNYFNNKSISLSDKEFIKYAYPQIKAAYEKLNIFERLIENESKFRAITENLTDVVVIRNLQGKYTYVSPSIKHYGLKASDVLGKEAMDFISPEDMPGIESALKTVIPIPGKTITLTSIKIILGDKNYIADMVLTNLLHVQGIKGIVINIQDNTDRVEVIKQVYESEEKYRSLLENANDGICLMTLDKVVFSNSKLSNMLRIPSGKLVGTNPVDFSPEYQPDGVPSKDRIAEVYRSTIKGDTQSFEFRLKRSDESEFEGLISVSSVKLFDGDYLMAIIRDITEIKELERKVLESTIKTEENERRRFARDLHDGIGPYLSATKMFLNTIPNVDDKEELEVVLDKAKKSIDEIISSIKEISNNISPHVLENFGLIAALNSFKKRVQRTDVDININTNVDSDRLDENIEITVFRIFIELVNNTFKYAKASIINISVFRIEDKLEIIFEHNGKGFNFDKIINENRGLGLLNIKNRVNSLQGECHFITSEDSDFVFRATFK